MNTRLIAALGVLAVSSLPAIAEVSAGGSVIIESNNDDCCDTVTNLRGEVALGYETDSFGVYAGTRFRETDDDFDLDSDDLFFAVSFGNITISSGKANGAGNVMTEDYFGLNDTTGTSGQDVRIDLDTDIGMFSISSNDDEGDQLEFGFIGSLGNNFLRIGYEQGDKDLQIATGQDFGQWGYHAVLHNDLDDGDGEDQFGLTLLYDVSDRLTVAAHAAIGNGDETLHSTGLMAWYEIDPIGANETPVTFRAEFMQHNEWDESSVELSVIVPFGKAAPNNINRLTNKEVLKGFGY